MKNARTARLGTLAVSAALTLAACSGSTDDEGQSSEAAAAVDEPLVVTYDGGLWVLDGETLEVASDIPMEGFNRVNPAGDDDHVMV